MGFGKKILVAVILFWLGHRLWTFKWKLVVVCDVGQGNAVLINDGWNQMLLDTGRGSEVTKCLSDYMPWGDRKIEAIALSHDDDDHVGGLSEIKKYYEIEQIFNTKNIKKNDMLRLGTIAYDVRWPEEYGEGTNENSVAGLITFEGKTLWVGGDIDSEGEQKIVWRENLPKVDYMLLSHHGARTSNSEEIIEALQPKEVLITVGKNNYGHPDSGLLKNLENMKIKIRRTDQEGDLIL